MREIKARDIATKAEVVVLDLSEDYSPAIGQLVETTTGQYEVCSFVEVDLNPLLHTSQKRSREKVLLLSLQLVA